MSKLKNLLAIGALAAGTMLPLKAQETPVNEPPKKISLTGVLSNDFFSQYYFRGLPYSEKNEPVFQTYLGVTPVIPGVPFDLTTGFFGSYNFKTGLYDEADLMINLSKSFGDFSASINYGYFTSPTNSWKDSHDLGATLSWNSPIATFSLTGGGDFLNGNGGYLEFNGSKTFSLAKIGNTEVSLRMGATTGFNFHNSTSRDGLSYLDLKLGVPIKIDKNITLEPSVMHQIPLRSDFKRDTIFGFNVSYSF